MPRQKSILGQHSALNWLAGGNFLTAIRSYYDKSGNTKLAALAGFCSTDTIWTEFENGWKQVLTDRTPPATYMHMREARGLMKEFDRKKGWTDAKVHKLIWDLVIFLSKHKKQFRGFICTIDEAGRKKLVSEHVEIPRSLEICSDNCTRHAIKWSLQECSGIIESMDFFFDRGDGVKAIFEKAVNEGKKTEMYQWHLVNTVAEADMKLTPGIQAADMLAWSATRGRSDKIRPWSGLWKIFLNVVPVSVVHLTESRLRQKYGRVSL